MNVRGLKSFISRFVCTVLLLSFVLPHFDNISYLAATAATSTTETTKRKTVGHKIEGAEYYPELYDKISVWGVDNGGGMGQGGGAGDNNASNAGNSGTYDDAGGTFGHAAGQGLGGNDAQHVGGTGSGTTGGSTGSAKADSLRALKAQIEESRAESLKRVLQTAGNAESVMASIEEQERIQSSMQRRNQQESIRAKITQNETLQQYETPVYIEQTIRIVETAALDVETHSPTSEAKLSLSSQEREMPTTRLIEQLEVSDMSIRPSPRQIDVYDSYEEVVESRIVSEFEPGDFVAETKAKNLITYNEVQTSINSPTSDMSEEVEHEETVEVYESPIVEAETTVEMTNSTNDREETETSEFSNSKDKEEGKGSKGGEDAEKEEDKAGDDAQNESEGHADNKGQYQKETEGEYAGKKIFELDRNGDIGLDAEHLSVTNLKGLMNAVLTLLFLLGALTFILGSRDKHNKNNYF